MMNLFLAVTCFMPNATFVYNPITTIGILTATYLPRSNSNGYDICEKLDTRLARATVELANNQAPPSANFQFRHGSNIEIPITFTTIEQQEAAILTAQSNFIIAMLDMDAEVKQTLAYFSVQSYNANNCLKSLTNTIVGNTMTVTGDQAGCDYSMTLNALPDASFTPEQVNNTVWAKITCQEMYIQISVGIQFSTPSSSFEVIFDCDLGNSKDFNKTTCLAIIKNFTFAPMTQSSFQLHYQLVLPSNEYFRVEQRFDSIVDPKYLDCYTDSSYQINDDIVIFYFTPSGGCNFNTSQNQMIIGLSDTNVLKLARQWVFQQSNYSFDSETIKISIECSQLSIEGCGELLNYINKLEIIFVTVTFVVYDEFGKANFIVISPRRYQECYEYGELTISYKNGAEAGSIEIRNNILGFIGCQFQYPARMELTLHLYRKTIAEGLITDIEATPFFILNQRSILSIENKTVLFDNITDLGMLREISSQIINKKFYCIAYYDGLILPVIKYNDLTHIYDNTSIYIITAVGGIIGGLVVGGIEYFLARKQK